MMVFFAAALTVFAGRTMDSATVGLSISYALNVSQLFKTNELTIFTSRVAFFLHYTDEQKSCHLKRVTFCISTSYLGSRCPPPAFPLPKQLEHTSIMILCYISTVFAPLPQLFTPKYVLEGLSQWRRKRQSKPPGGKRWNTREVHLLENSVL